MRRDEAIRRLLAVRDPLHALGVTRIDLIGSVARDSAGADSDVDVLIDLARGADLLERHFAVQDLLEAAMGCRVDVVLSSTVKPLAKRVMDLERVNVA